MEDNFRNILIILSAIIITAIFIHGLWTIRKQKNPYKLKASKDKIEPRSRDFDQKGFDQDGVGQVKVKTNQQKNCLSPEDEVVAEHILNAGIDLSDDLSKSQIVIKNDVLGDLSQVGKQVDLKAAESSVQNLDATIEDDWFKEDNNEANSVAFSKDELGDELTAVANEAGAAEIVRAEKVKAPVHIEPLYAEPVTQAKPARATINKVSKPSSKASLKRNQMEIDFDSQLDEQAVTVTEEPVVEQAAQVNTELEPQVIILSVVMPANQQILGAALLPSLLTLGLKYGEMNIFHRHQDNAGNGKVTFSLANIMNPGSFDLDSMESFATRGVSLFMTLPNAGDPLQVFDQMLNAAKQLAHEFNAQVIDDKRNVVTKQTEQHYISKIREFDRKSRIALVM
ncbi:MAG: cell division protein ZipA [Colwellia sp.]|nr:cell division protein ZipA [Colwellia sp.]